MSDIPGSPGWANGISFLARLYLLKDGNPFPITVGRESRNFEGSVYTQCEDSVITSLGHQAYPLLFRFSSNSSGRLDFYISRSDQNMYLTTNRLGDLMVQSSSSPSDSPAYTFEPLEWGEDRLRCKMFDHRGSLIRARPITHTYGVELLADQLSVSQGNVHEFLIERC